MESRKVDEQTIIAELLAALQAKDARDINSLEEINAKILQLNSEFRTFYNNGDSLPNKNLPDDR